MVKLYRNLKLGMLESTSPRKAPKHTQLIESNQFFLMSAAVVLKLI